MKKIWLLLSFTLLYIASFAQEPADALRYAWYVPGASARIKAVGGAMGSLGGDITATYVNPAGLGFYKTGDFVLSPQFGFGNTKSNYLGTSDKKNGSKFTWGATGLVMGSPSSGSKVRSSAFSLAFNRTADFNSDIEYRGQNNQSSYSQKYLEEIRNNNETDAHNIAIGTGNYRFGAALALQTGWIDTVAGGSAGNYQFHTLAPVNTGLLQQNTIHSSGGINEIALGYAVNVKDKLYIGGSLGVPIVKYNRTTEFVEADATSNPDNNFNYAAFSDNLQTTGVGLNLRAGLIYKLADVWRLGLAFHSPTIYQLTDKYSSSITTDTEKYLGVSTSSSNDADFINSYGEYQFKYMFTTPYRAIGSISYVLHEAEDVRQQKGFLSADVEFVNYKSTSFQPYDPNYSDQGTKDYLTSLNQAIKQAYKGAFNFRAGGELKFTTLMVRAGFAYYGNPYKNINGENGNRMNISGGLGYRNKGIFVDLTYVQALTKDTNFPYRLQYAPYHGAALKTSAGNIFLTVGFKI